MHVHELNWMQLEEYLTQDDRVVLPVGSTEQHGYLSLGPTTSWPSASRPRRPSRWDCLCLPVVAYGLTPSFAAFPGAPHFGSRPSRRAERPARLAPRPGLSALPARQRSRRQHAGGSLAREWAAAQPDAQAIFHSWCPAITWSRAKQVDRSRATRTGSNFPWTRLPTSSCPKGEAAARRGRLPRGLTRGHPRAPRRRCFRRGLRAAGRADRRGLANRGEEVASCSRALAMKADPLADFHAWSRPRAGRRARAGDDTLATADATAGPPRGCCC